jgi:hypothetical protein
MKVQIPDELKTDLPHSAWGKILTSTPVVMAVVATMLAGLASSEMTKAQYDRSLAAQQQSKAGDQWSFFQAKRLRGAYQRNTYEILQNIGGARPLGAATYPEQLLASLGQNDSASRPAEIDRAKTELSDLLVSPAGRQALTLLERGVPPEVASANPANPDVQAALDAVASSKSEAEIAPAITRISDADLEQALRNAKDQAQAFDVATKPSNAVMDRVSDLLAGLTASLQAVNAPPELARVAPAVAALSRDYTAATLRYGARRYEIEARLNQAIADFYEIQVRRSNLSAERHHRRSQRFFFGMLAAQLGVIIGTFAIAARQRNLLWSLAAAAGLLAIAFAIYVYVFL